MNSWCTVSLYSHFFSSIWRKQRIWSVVELLRRNPHWWSTIISSMYGTNFERRIFDKILYEVDRNDIYICYVEESRLPLCSSGQSSRMQNGDVLCLLWDRNWIYICYVKKVDRLCGLVMFEFELCLNFVRLYDVTFHKKSLSYRSENLTQLGALLKFLARQ
jgi:hypothetical protein